MADGINPNRPSNSPNATNGPTIRTEQKKPDRSEAPARDEMGGQVTNTATRNLQDPLTLDSFYDYPNLGRIEIFRKSNNDGSMTFYIKNHCYTPFEANFVLKVDGNVQKKTILVAPRKPGEKEAALTEAFTIRGNYKYDSNFALGDPKSEHDDKALYSLPFKKGQSFLCGQGEHGKETHQQENEFALDFNMPEGTEFTAMRDGVVIAVKQDSNKGGKNVDPREGNFIWIRHEDGSEAKYVHIQKNGSKVQKGQAVKAGDVIGLSGNTGRTDGPHLHVQVDVNKGSKGFDLISIPFRDKDGKSIIIEEGKTYGN